MLWREKKLPDIKRENILFFSKKDSFCKACMYVQYVLLLFVYLRLDQDKDLSTACPFFQNLYSLKINKRNNTKQIQKSFFLFKMQ